MNRTELKNIIKEAILELVSEGKIQMGSSTSLAETKNVSSIRKNSNQLAEMIRSNAQQSAGNPAQQALLHVLADTAQTTFVRQKETEEYGYTSEEKDRFDSLFPNDLKEHFSKLFDKPR